MLVTALHIATKINRNQSFYSAKIIASFLGCTIQNATIQGNRYGLNPRNFVIQLTSFNRPNSSHSSGRYCRDHGHRVLLSRCFSNCKLQDVSKAIQTWTFSSYEC